MTDTTKDRPIMMKAADVRAILDGRKTVTRRILKPRPPSSEAVRDRMGDDFHLYDSAKRGGRPGEWCIAGSVGAVCEIAGLPNDYHWRCPFGVPGDRLWVREGFALACHNPENFFDGDEESEDTHSVVYREGSDPNAKWDRYHENEKGEFVRQKKQIKPPWRPSIFMPRWASRFTLEVVSVRVERLQEIDDADIGREGVRFDGTYWLGCKHPVKGTPKCFVSAREAFASLWWEIHGEESWAANPWVWRIEFRRVSK